jgi:Beta-lactamase enzyme family
MKAAATRSAAVAAAVAAAAGLVAFLTLRAGGESGASGSSGAAAGAEGGLMAGRHSGAGQSGLAAATRGDPLGKAAAGYAAGRTGSVLAAVYDVRTGRSWSLGTGPPQAEASVVKLDILETLLAAHSGAGRSGAGHSGAGLGPADQDLARAMIEDSDNDAATSLWEAAGGAAGVSAFNGRAGLTSTTPSLCVSCAGFAWPGWGLTTTRPADQLALLKQLVVPGSRPLLSDTQRSYMLSLMERVAPGQRWGVSGGVPSGVTVALKNGWLPLNAASTDWQVNSVGWVSGDGRDYLIAVLTVGSPTEQYGIDTINALSSVIWTALR